MPYDPKEELCFEILMVVLWGLVGVYSTAAALVVSALVIKFLV